MALILKAKTKRNGEIKRFDVVKAVDSTEAVKDTLDGAKAGTYHVHTDNGTLVTAAVSYRTVQDIVLS